MSVAPFVGLLAIAVSISAYLGQKSVTTEIHISAPPEKVWQVLTDMEAYAEWNPVFEYQGGELTQSGKITYRVTEAENKSAIMSAQVKKVVPNRLLNQSGGLWGIITFDHTYTLTEVEKGTKVRIFETYTGVYVNFWDESAIAKQYKKLALALKKRVEELS